MKALEIQREALHRAESGESLANYPAIFAYFGAKGIPEDEIIPRITVLSFNAWKAKGRFVKRGEHGCKIMTVLNKTRRNKSTGLDESFSMPWSVTVFHVSQTAEYAVSAGQVTV